MSPHYTPHIEVGSVHSDGCTSITDSVYPTLLSSPRHALGRTADAENIEPPNVDAVRVHKVRDDREAVVEGSQRMTALIEAVKLSTSQPGVVPKRYAQKAKLDLSAPDGASSVSALIDAVRMAHAPRSAADNVESRPVDGKDIQNIHVDQDADGRSQRMMALTKAVKLVTSQPGVGPKRYAHKPKLDLSATDRASSVTALIDAVRMAHAPRSFADNVESRPVDGKGFERIHVDQDANGRSQRMKALTKAVKLVTSQPGVGPKRYVRKTAVGLGAADTASSMSVLIDAVRMSMRKPASAC